MRGQQHFSFQGITSYLTVIAIGVGLALGIGWILHQFSGFFLNLKIPISQQLVLGTIPFLLGGARWFINKSNRSRQAIEQNALEISKLQEQAKEFLQSIQKLEKSALWSQIQIENLYSRLDELEDKD